VRSTGFSTSVAKKELSIANLMVEKAAKLDRDTFGVAVGQGPWQRQRRLGEEIGGIKPLAFGQFGEMGPGLEALLASMAKQGAADGQQPREQQRLNSTGGSTKGNAPHCTPKTAEFALLHAPLSTRLDEISCR
jgi:hypothetical protein